MAGGAGWRRDPSESVASLCQAATGDQFQTLLDLDESPLDLLMTIGLIYALPPAAIYYVFKWYMVGGLTAGAVTS